MKKILVINTAYTSFNGITSVIMNCVRKTEGMVLYDFVLCGKVEERFADELRQLGETVYLPPCSRVKQPLRYASWLKKVILKNGYDVIHVHGNSATMYLEIHAAKKAGVPVRIAHNHSTACKFKLAHYALKPLLNRELTQAVACSHPAGSWIFNGAYSVLPNGIDVDKFAFSQAVRDEYRKKLHIEDKLVIGHVGYMNTEKNHMFLLRVLETLVSRDQNICLLLIGGGRLQSEITCYIREHHLETFVKLLGKREDVAQLYQCMDVFALPSVFEGLSIALLEAQTAGLPCVASTGVPQEANAAKLVEYLDIRDTDIPKWCDAILQGAHRPQERARFGEFMKGTVFSAEQCADRLYGLYGIEKHGDHTPGIPGH